MKKLLYGIVSLMMLFSSTASAATYTWMARQGGLCSAVADGTDHSICLDSTSTTLYKCTTSGGTCTTPINGAGWTGNSTFVQSVGNVGIGTSSNGSTLNIGGLATWTFDGDQQKMGNTDASLFHIGGYATNAGTLAGLINVAHSTSGDFSHYYWTHNVPTPSNGIFTTTDDQSSSSYIFSMSDMGYLDIFYAPAKGGAGAPAFAASPVFDINMNTGAFGIGAPASSTATFVIGAQAYTDTGVLAQMTSSVAGYNQMIIQNTNSGATASANLVFNNNLGSSSSYAEVGINSSNFTGTSSFDLPSAAYLDSSFSDLVIGTLAAKSIHFVVNDGITDAMKIDGSDGGVSVGTTDSFANLDAQDVRAHNLRIVSGTVVTNSTGTLTLTAANLVHNTIFQETGTTPATFTTDTGSNISAAVQSPQTGDMYFFVISNASSQTVTLSGASGVSLTAAETVPTLTTRTFYMICTGSNTWSVY